MKDAVITVGVSFHLCSSFSVYSVCKTNFYALCYGGWRCRCHCHRKLAASVGSIFTMRTLELVQPFFTSFGFWNFFGFSSLLCSLVEGALVSKLWNQGMLMFSKGSKLLEISCKVNLHWKSTFCASDFDVHFVVIRSVVYWKDLDLIH